MASEKTKKWVAIALVLGFCLVALVVVCYWFQHKTLRVGDYEVVYFKNRCDIDEGAMPADLESLKALPCLIRISWRERTGEDLYQEYCYTPGKGVEKSRRIHTKN